MSRNTSVTIGKHYTEFVAQKIEEGIYGSTSEAIRAGLSLLEKEEGKMTILRETLAKGFGEIERGETTDGPKFMKELIDDL